MCKIKRIIRIWHYFSKTLLYSLFYIFVVLLPQLLVIKWPSLLLLKRIYLYSYAITKVKVSKSDYIFWIYIVNKVEWQNFLFGPVHIDLWDDKSQLHNKFFNFQYSFIELTCIKLASFYCMITIFSIHIIIFGVVKWANVTMNMEGQKRKSIWDFS